MKLIETTIDKMICIWNAGMMDVIADKEKNGDQYPQRSLMIQAHGLEVLTKREGHQIRKLFTDGHTQLLLDFDPEERPDDVLVVIDDAVSESDGRSNVVTAIAVNEM